MRTLPILILMASLVGCGEREESNCGDRLDDDRDGLVDCDDPDCSDDAACGPDDTGCEQVTWYPDGDGDGYGKGGDKVDACAQPSGYADNDEDCDDGDAEVNPGASEVCDEVDNDCDDMVDDDDSDVTGTTTWHLDGDGDGWGKSDDIVVACDEPSGYVGDGTDCDDGDEDVYPGADEVCDGVDNDCDDAIDDDDDDVVEATTWYQDGDGDGLGDSDSVIESCAQPTDYVLNDDDCDDSDAEVGAGSDEIIDGVDNDCDGELSWMVVPNGSIDEVHLISQDGILLDTLDVSADCTQPRGVARDVEGRAYVACAGSSATDYDVLVVETDGSFWSFRITSECTQAVAPAWDPEGYLWLSCTGASGQLAARYTTDGSFEDSWSTSGNGNAPATDRRGQVWIPNNAGSVVDVFDRDGTLSSYALGYENSHAVAIERDGTAWVTHSSSGHISLVQPDGSLETDITTGCASPGTIAFDRSGYAYVVCEEDLVVIDTVTHVAVDTITGIFGDGWGAGMSLDGRLWTNDMSGGVLSSWTGSGSDLTSTGDVAAGNGETMNGDFTGDLAWWLSKPGSQDISVSDNAIASGSGEVHTTLDIDNDGYDDLVTNNSGSQDGLCIWSGAALADWSSNGPTACWTADGGSVSYAYSGDLDGDGIEDLLVPDGNSQASYLFFGGAFPSSGVSTLSAAADLEFLLSSPSGTYSSAGEYCGIADLDGDGREDLVMGTNLHSTDDVGMGWFLLGRDRKDWESLDGLNLFTYADVTLESDVVGMGKPATILGDLDGDGNAEIALGAGNRTDGSTRRGAVVVYQGIDVVTAAAGTGSLTSADAIELWLDQGYGSGDAGGMNIVFPVGDMDGDGLAEFMATSPNGDFVDTDRGGAVLIYGDEVPFTSGAVDSVATVFAASSGGGGMGSFKLPVGDLDGDGFDDLMVTNRYHESGGSSAGALYVLFGGPLRWERHTEWLPIGYAETSFLGDSGSQLGYATAGDFDNDGLLEIAYGNTSGFHVIDDHTTWPR